MDAPSSQPSDNNAAQTPAAGAGAPPWSGAAASDAYAHGAQPTASGQGTDAPAGLNDAQRQSWIARFTDFDDTDAGLAVGRTYINQKLEADGLLPSFGIINTSDNNADIAPASRKDWTVGIDLMASLPQDGANILGGGVEREMNEIAKLVKESKDHSVNFIVHAEIPLGKDLQFCDTNDGKLNASCIGDSIENRSAITSSFFIHDGKIETLVDRQNSSAAQDLNSLMAEMKALAPADHVGLILQSHGGGSSGLGSNLGDLPMDTLVSTIQNGLKGSGHDKLDLLDYDSCDMATAKVMQMSAPIAKDVVASAGVEAATLFTDGQNIAAAMRRLAKNTKMDGEQLGAQIVREAAIGANGVADNNATKTLANFDLRNYDSYQQTLDRFGTALSALQVDDKNMPLIQADINGAVLPYSGDPDYAAHDRDLKGFAENILRDSEANKFSGDNAATAQAARDLLQSMAAMTPQHYGDSYSGYDKIGGLTVNLPGQEVYDRATLAKETSPLSILNDNTSMILEGKYGYKDKAMFESAIKYDLKDIPKDLQHQYPEEMRLLREAASRVHKADEGHFIDAVQHFKSVLDQIEQSPLGQKVGEETAQEQLERFAKSPVDQIVPGWDDFIAGLRERIAPNINHAGSAGS